MLLIAESEKIVDVLKFHESPRSRKALSNEGGEISRSLGGCTPSPKQKSMPCIRIQRYSATRNSSRSGLRTAAELFPAIQGAMSTRWQPGRWRKTSLLAILSGESR